MASQNISKVLPIDVWAVQTEVSTYVLLKLSMCSSYSVQFKGCQAPSKEHNQFEIFPN